MEIVFSPDKCIMHPLCDNVVTQPDVGVIYHKGGSKKAMIIAHEPSETRAKKSRIPFDPNVGHPVTRVFKQQILSDFTDCTVYVTNLVKCKGGVAKLCWPYLLHEMAMFRPDVIVIVGKTTANLIKEIEVLYKIMLAFREVWVYEHPASLFYTRKKFLKKTKFI